MYRKSLLEIKAQRLAKIFTLFILEIVIFLGNIFCYNELLLFSLKLKCNASQQKKKSKKNVDEYPRGIEVVFSKKKFVVTTNVKAQQIFIYLNLNNVTYLHKALTLSRNIEGSCNNEEEHI